MTPSGIENATFLFVEHCLNQLCHVVLHIEIKDLHQKLSLHKRRHFVIRQKNCILPVVHSTGLSYHRQYSFDGRPFKGGLVKSTTKGAVESSIHCNNHSPTVSAFIINTNLCGFYERSCTATCFDSQVQDIKIYKIKIKNYN